MGYHPEYIVLAIEHLCPGLVHRVDFNVVNDGSGPKIDEWFRPDVAQPTMDQITVVDTDALLLAQRTILPQDLMAQFTVDDAVKIQTAIGGNIGMWLLWNSLTTQKDPMVVANARFQQGWTALVSVLGQSRMTEIATALGVTI
jgi:hypothetical protein